MSRDRYSEKVPFRLTRMLINAMEVSGIEGNFRGMLSTLNSSYLLKKGAFSNLSVTGYILTSVLSILLLLFECHCTSLSALWFSV